MKKGLFPWISFTAAIFVSVVVFMPCAEARDYIDTIYKPFHRFVDSILPVASRIASQTSPILEEVESVEEETQAEWGYPPQIYGRAWKIDKTCVAYAYQKAWKGASLSYFWTTDSSLSFAGGIKVGSTVKQLEKFFQWPHEAPGEAYSLLLDSQGLSFEIRNGRITRISFGSPEVNPIPSKVWNFIKYSENSLQSSPAIDTSDDADEEDELDKELARLAEEFAKEKRLPPSVTAGGDINVIRSYTAQFRAVKGRGANLYALPDEGARIVVPLKEGAALTAEAEWTARDARGSWYYVTTKKGHSGWVPAQFITDREAE